MTEQNQNRSDMNKKQDKSLDQNRDRADKANIDKNKTGQVNPDSRTSRS